MNFFKRMNEKQKIFFFYKFLFNSPQITRKNLKKFLTGKKKLQYFTLRRKFITE